MIAFVRSNLGRAWRPLGPGWRPASHMRRETATPKCGRVQTAPAPQLCHKCGRTMPDILEKAQKWGALHSRQGRPIEQAGRHSREGLWTEWFEWHCSSGRLINTTQAWLLLSEMCTIGLLRGLESFRSGRSQFLSVGHTYGWLPASSSCLWGRPHIWTAD